ncbi:ABC transporter permease [Undibacterium sp. Ren11W]|uniref:ABC transporter permease n=1 Tax=Undibacterium sp. Ren11W TaxID=3413045 RepID=UPI003BF161E8
MSKKKTSAWRRVMRREWLALRANPWELALMSWWPLLLLAILWWTLAAGLPRNLPLVWVDHDKSASSRQLLQLLESSPTLGLSLRLPDEMAAMHAVRSGHALAWLVVPRDFERDIKHGVAPTVHLQVNAQQSTGAGMVKSQVQTALALFSAGAELKIRTAQGESAASAMNNLEPLRPGLMTLFNGSMNYEAFLVPALGTALLQLFAMFIAVACVGRELKHGTVKAWLEHADGNLLTALAAKLVINLAPLALLTCGMLFGLSLVRGFVVQGSLPLLLLAHLLGLLANAALGVVAVLATRSLRMGLSVAGVIASPAFTYSGAGYPLMAMPLAAQAWAWLLPLTHLLRLQAEQWGMGAPVIYSLDDLWVLAAMAIFPCLLVPRLMSRCLSADAWGRA